MTAEVVIGFTGEVNAASVSRLLSVLNHAMVRGAPKATVSITSVGGYISDGINAYTHIRALPMHVDTFCSGAAESAALFIFLAGKRRIAGKFSRFMLHPASTGALPGGLNLTTQVDAERSLSVDEARIEALLRDSGVTDENIIQARRKGNLFLSAEDAVKAGIAHAAAAPSIPAGAEVIQLQV